MLGSETSGFKDSKNVVQSGSNTVDDDDQIKLLKKLQQENEKLEEDCKAPAPSSLNKKFHSRQNSVTSLLSNNSIASSGSSIHFLSHDSVNQLQTLESIQDESKEHALINSKGSKAQDQNNVSPTAMPKNLDSWLSLISEWEHSLKNEVGSHKLSKIRHRAVELFCQTWSIPDAFRGLVWQLVCGAREENAASVILAPSAITSTLSNKSLRLSALLSTEHLPELGILNKDIRGSSHINSSKPDQSTTDSCKISTNSGDNISVKDNLCIRESIVSPELSDSFHIGNIPSVVVDKKNEISDTSRCTNSFAFDSLKSQCQSLLDSKPSIKNDLKEEMSRSQTANNAEVLDGANRQLSQKQTESDGLSTSNKNVFPVTRFASRRFSLQCSTPLKYADLLAVPSPHERTISRDVARTYPSHTKFKATWGEGQESLFNVARAYSVYDREVGYCQGSSFIIGLLLMHMPEEDAFGVFVRIMYAYNLRDLFKPSMEALGLKMFQLEHLIYDHLPLLHSIFSSHGIRASMFASPWFLTLFATSLPLTLAYRAFDAFLCQGLDVVFRLGLALLKLNQNCLLGLNMEDMVQFLQKDLGAKAEADPDLFFMTAFQLKISPKRMKKLEKEYVEVNRQEKEEQAELVRLRNENRRLQSLVDKLEKETGSLADTLVSRQIQCAELAEETTALRHAVASVRKLFADQKSESFSPVDDIKKCESHTAEDNHRVNINKSSPIKNDLENSLLLAELESVRDELIGCKLREAESNLSIKKLQHEIHEIQKLWKKVNSSQNKSQQDQDGHSIFSIGPFKSSISSVPGLEQALLTNQIKEAGLLSELTDARLNLASLEQKVNSLEKKNSQLEKELRSSNMEIGSLIRDSKTLSEVLLENERNQKVLKEKSRILELENQELKLTIELLKKEETAKTIGMDCDWSKKKPIHPKPVAAVAGNNLTKGNVLVSSLSIKSDQT